MMRRFLPALMLASLPALAQTGPVPLAPEAAPVAPATAPTPARAGVSGLTPVTGGLKVDAKLPTECGGAALGDDWVARQAALETCLQDLTKRLSLAEVAAKLSGALTGSAGTSLSAPTEAVAQLRSVPTKSVLEVVDEGDGRGVRADDGRRPLAKAPAAPTGNAVPEITSLADVSLIGGGCQDVCVAIFKIGDNAYPVKRVGDFIAPNATVKSIDTKGGKLVVRVQLEPPGQKATSKEFVL